MAVAVTVFCDRCDHHGCHSSDYGGSGVYLEEDEE